MKTINTNKEDSMIRKIYYWFMPLLLLLPVAAMGQDMVIEDYFTNSQYLNVEIAADTSSAAFKAGTRVYVLRKNGIYAWNATLSLSAGSILNIRAESGGTGYNPEIYFFPTGTGTNPSAPPGNMAQLNGNTTVSLSNIMVSGYEETQDTLLQYANTSMLQATASGTNNRIIIDSCIMKTIAGQIIRTDGPATIIKVTHSIFADMGHPTSNFGAGKFIDARNVRIDTLIVQNCTLVNLYDRVIRHYQAAGANCLVNFTFDHNTVVNDMAYHGFLSLGTVDSSGTGNLQITNNLLVDHFALGEDTAYVRQVEFSDPGENDPTNGSPRMTWVLTNPNNAAKWNISNNYYGSTDSGAAMLALGPPNDDQYAGPFYHREGPPYLTWNMNTVLASQGKDTVNTFTPLSYIKLAKQPGLMTELIRWVLDKNLDDKNKPKLNVSPIWNWTYDFHRHKLEYYSDTLNCSYSFVADTDLAVASTDGKVIGDTRWTGSGLVSPRVPALVSPNDTTGVPRKATLTWAAAYGATSYHVQVAPDIGFSSIAADTTLANTTVKLSTALTATKKYYWRVASVNDTIASAYSVVDSFTTGTGIDAVEGKDGIPKTFALFQNYPNPFNPSTAIKYNLPKAQMVTLKVYDILGQDVATLVNERQNAGYYNVNFSAARMASGVYFYVLRTEGFSSTHKMLFLK
jgi:Secretion system C-terminal sorting domain